MGSSASSYVRTWSPYEKYIVPRDVFWYSDNHWSGVLKELDEYLYEENRRRRRRRCIRDDECVCGRRHLCANVHDEQGWFPQRNLPKWQPMPVYVVGQASPRSYAYQQPLNQQPALQQDDEYSDYEEYAYPDPQCVRAPPRGAQGGRRHQQHPGYDPRGYAGRARRRQQQQQDVVTTPDDEMGDDGEFNIGEENGVEGERQRRRRSRR